MHSRRRFLATLSAASAAFALPFLRSESRAQQGASGPQRLLVLQTPDGRPWDHWKPTGSGTNFQFGSTMRAFEPLKAKSVLISGLAHLCYTFEPHCGGLVQWMTGMDGNFNNDNYTSAKAPSVDQLIAKNAAFVGATRFPSLQIAADSSAPEQDISHRIFSWAGNNQPLPGELRPIENYKRIFEGVTLSTGGAPSPEAERTIAERRSVLDLLVKDWQRMAEAIPAGQKEFFDAHLEAFRALERNLETFTVTAGCSAPNTSQYPSQPSNQSFPDYFNVNLEIVRLAFACDLTRVVTFMSSPTTSGLNHKRWNSAVPTDMGHHESSHARLLDNLVPINTWYSERIAEFVARLDQTQDGARSLLDSSLVIYGTELGDGREHDLRNPPFVLFGSAGGKLQTGRYLDFLGNVSVPANGEPEDVVYNPLSATTRSSNDVWLSVLQAFSMPTSTVGDPKKCGGPIPGLLA